MFAFLVIGFGSILKIFPSATTDQIITLEKAFSIKLPEELKNLLSETNGVRGKYEFSFLWSVEQILKERTQVGMIGRHDFVKAEKIVHVMLFAS